MNPNTATNYDLKIKKRIQLVHIAANELGLLDPKRHNTDADDDYHRILARWNRQGTRQPVTSSLQMTYEQLGELLDFFKGLGFKLKSNHPSPRPSPSRGEGGWKKYESSIKGLREEVVDLARVRWGDTWSSSLNSLCKKFGVDHYNFLDLSHGKAIKNKLIEWTREPGMEG